MYVESGLPVVVALSGHGHAITILCGFIANDDNFLPYHGVRKNNSVPDGYWSRFKMEDIDTFIVPLYEKIHLSAEHVVKLSEAILTEETLGLNARSNLLKHEDVITRTFLTSSKSFKKMRRGDSLPLGIANVYCEMAMPKFIWVCELSTPELFKDGKIAGEILFDATANPHDIMAFLSIHYPDFLLLNNRDFLINDPKRFNIYNVDTNKIIPYYCYANNLSEV